MLRRKYILDASDLQYKQVKLPWKQKFFQSFLWLACSIVVSVIYISLFENYYGSPKEKELNQNIESQKLKLSMLGRKLDNAMKQVNSLQLSDDKRYRPVLNMETIPESFRKPGYGGVDRFRDLNGYLNSDFLIALWSELEDIKNRANIQNESFNSILERKDEWKREMDYVPIICPVDVSIGRGDGIKLRDVHPVLGTTRWHFGQDFNAPYGTQVYATGAGRVTTAGWSSNGFGNHVIIDHGYGFQTIYGHLSSINVTIGENVKRGDMIGVSGSSGTSSGPHLHYQVELNGNHQNPLFFFADDLTEDEYREMIQMFSLKSKFR
jgi:murein DD-endopeptidase MepM/ murein hydrolase activator NlpD